MASFPNIFISRYTYHHILLDLIPQIEVVNNIPRPLKYGRCRDEVGNFTTSNKRYSGNKDEDVKNHKSSR